MSDIEELAEFVRAVNFEELGRPVVQQVKIRVLGALGAAIAALDEPAMVGLRDGIRRTDGGGRTASLMGGGRTSAGRAAFYNTALAGCLDFTDSYMGSNGCCRPSDCIFPVLAVAEGVGASGTDLIAGVALGYAIQARLCEADSLPPALSTAYARTACAVAGAASRVLKLDAPAVAAALGTLMDPARSEPAALPPAGAAREPSLGAARAAAEGVAAALAALRRADRAVSADAGPSGAGKGFAVDWSHADPAAVLRSVVKRHFADIRLQAVIDAAISIGTPPVCQVHDIQSVRVVVSRRDADDDPVPGTGNTWHVSSKAQAEHSLAYAVAVALIDHQVQPPQYVPARIARPDVQSLLRKVCVVAPPESTRRTLDEVPAQVEVRLHDGTVYCVSASSYRGFSLRQLDWDAAWTRFRDRVVPVMPERLAVRIADVVYRLDERPVQDLTALFAHRRSGASAHSPSSTTAAAVQHRSAIGERDVVEQF